MPNFMRHLAMPPRKAGDWDVRLLTHAFQAARFARCPDSQIANRSNPGLVTENLL